MIRQVYVYFKNFHGQTVCSDCKFVRDGDPVRMTDWMSRNLVRIETLTNEPQWDGFQHRWEYNPVTGSYN